MTARVPRGHSPLSHCSGKLRRPSKIMELRVQQHKATKREAGVCVGLLPRPHPHQPQIPLGFVSGPTSCVGDWLAPIRCLSALPLHRAERLAASNQWVSQPFNGRVRAIHHRSSNALLELGSPTTAPSFISAQTVDRLLRVVHSVSFFCVLQAVSTSFLSWEPEPPAFCPKDHYLRIAGCFSSRHCSTYPTALYSHRRLPFRKTQTPAPWLPGRRSY